MKLNKLTKEEERYNSDFFFVNRFPYAIKPFYVMRFDDEPQWARSVDLMYKGLEEGLVKSAMKTVSDECKDIWGATEYNHTTKKEEQYCSKCNHATPS